MHNVIPLKKQLVSRVGSVILWRAPLYCGSGSNDACKSHYRAALFHESLGRSFGKNKEQKGARWPYVRCFHPKRFTVGHERTFTAQTHVGTRCLVLVALLTFSVILLYLFFYVNRLNDFGWTRSCGGFCMSTGWQRTLLLVKEHMRHSPVPCTRYSGYLSILPLREKCE